MRTVLIVEDEWAIADWLEVLLGENGYNVLSAGNGREALDILHRETPDLVLTDFMMPFVDGAGLIAAMQEKPATRDIPVVVMTSLLESVVRDRVEDRQAGDLSLRVRRREQRAARAERASAWRRGALVVGAVAPSLTKRPQLDWLVAGAAQRAGSKDYRRVGARDPCRRGVLE